MKILSALLFLLLFALISCKKQTFDTKIKSNQWDIVHIEGDNSGLAGDTILLTVYYPTSSGCDVLDRFETTVSGNTCLVRAYGHILKNFCTMNAMIKPAIYKFSTQTRGTYDLRFQRKDGSFLTHNMTIN
jgi:hypothetical protein